MSINNDSGSSNSLKLPIKELAELSPEALERVMAFAQKEADLRHERLSKEFNLKVWGLIFSFIITSIALMLGTFMIMHNYEKAGMVAIVFGGGLTIAGNLIKKATKMVSENFLRTGS